MIPLSAEPATPQRLMSLPRRHRRNLSRSTTSPCPTQKLGKQKLLRCMRVNRNGEIIRSSFSEAESDGSKQSMPERRTKDSLRVNAVVETDDFDVREVGGGKDPDLGIEEIRENLEEEAEARPWSVRTRRAACKAPNEIGEACREIPPSSSGMHTMTRTLAEGKNGKEEVLSLLVKRGDERGFLEHDRMQTTSAAQEKGERYTDNWM